MCVRGTPTSASACAAQTRQQVPAGAPGESDARALMARLRLPARRFARLANQELHFRLCERAGARRPARRLALRTRKAAATRHEKVSASTTKRVSTSFAPLGRPRRRTGRSPGGSRRSWWRRRRGRRRARPAVVRRRRQPGRRTPLRSGSRPPDTPAAQRAPACMRRAPQCALRVSASEWRRQRARDARWRVSNSDARRRADASRDAAPRRLPRSQAQPATAHGVKHRGRARRADLGPGHSFRPAAGRA